MRPLLFVFCFLAQEKLSAQLSFANQLEAKEREFSLYSQVYGLRSGFLTYLDTGCISVNKNGATNLYKTWSQRENTPSNLVWYPTRVFALQRNQLGITSGPYFIKPSGDSAFQFSGYFFTVWSRKEKADSLKVVLDVGIRAQKIETKDSSRIEVKKSDIYSGKAEKMSKPGFNAALFRQSASDFNDQSRKEGLYAAIGKAVATDFELLVSGEGKVDDLQKIKTLPLLKEPVSLNPVGMIYSENNKAAVYYGQMEAHVKGQVQKGFFVQVWVRNTAAVHNKDASMPQLICMLVNVQ
jgi:hypothetical protein